MVLMMLALNRTTPGARHTSQNGGGIIFNVEWEWERDWQRDHRITGRGPDPCIWGLGRRALLQGNGSRCFARKSCVGAYYSSRCKQRVRMWRPKPGPTYSRCPQRLTGGPTSRSIPICIMPRIYRVERAGVPVGESLECSAM